MPEPQVIKTDKDLPIMEVPPPAPPSQAEIARLKQQIAIEEDIKRRTDEYADISRERFESTKKQQAEMAPAYQQAQELFKEREKVLKETPIPKPPDITPPSQQAPIDKSTAELMGSVGLIISSIAGFGGRMNGIRMNQALAGFLNGYHDGRYADAEFARRQWHDMFEYQIALYKNQVEFTRDILSRSGMTVENKVAEINLRMAQYNDYQEGMERRERGLATIITDLRQQESLVQRMSDLDERIKDHELRRKIDIGKYNLDVMKYLHPEKTAGAGSLVEQDKRAIALRQMGLPADTPLGNLTQEQAAQYAQLVAGGKGTKSTDPKIAKYYLEEIEAEAGREYERQLPIVKREAKERSKATNTIISEKEIVDETVRRVDNFVRSTYRYKVVGSAPNMFANLRTGQYGREIRVAPMLSQTEPPQPAARSAPARAIDPKKATEFEYRDGKVIPTR